MAKPVKFKKPIVPRLNRALTEEEIAWVMKRVSAIFGIPADKLRAHRNKTPRFVAMYIMWNCYDTSHTEIAKAFGYTRSMSNIADRFVERERLVNRALEKIVSDLEQEIIQRRL